MHTMNEKEANGFAQRMMNMGAHIDWRHGILGVLLLCTVCWCLFLLGARTLFLFDRYAYHGDAAFYFTIGKSILNGLTPYRDIFDPKPPGVFIVSAISFFLVHSHMLGNYLSIIMLLCTPVLFVWMVWNPSSALPPANRLLVRAAGCVAGCIISLWSSIQAGVWQPESFGNFFALLFIIMYIRGRHHMTLLRTIAASACVLFAIGSKEPFLLTLFAAAIAIDVRPLSLLRAFFIPLGIALATGSLVLAALGWLEPYVSLYLPTIVGIRIQYDVPLWMRGVYFWKTSGALSYSSALLFPSLLCLFAWRAADIILSRERVFSQFFGLVFGAYLSVTAVGLAGNYAMLSYAASLVPFFTALIFLMLFRMCDPHAKFRLPLMAFGSAVLMAIVWTIPLSRAAPVITDQEMSQIDSLTTAAARLDGLLSACEVDRYLYAVNPPQPLLTAYTTHSPLNHFPYRQIDKITFGLPFLSKSLERLSQSSIIVTNSEGFVPSDSLGQMLGNYIQSTFTNESPPCAKDYLPIGDYSVLFRISPTSISVSEVTDDAGQTRLEFSY